MTVNNTSSMVMRKWFLPSTNKRRCCKGSSIAARSALQYHTETHK